MGIFGEHCSVPHNCLPCKGPLSSLSEGGVEEESNGGRFFRLQFEGRQITSGGCEKPMHAGSKSLKTHRSSSGKLGRGLGPPVLLTPSPPEVRSIVSGVRAKPFTNFLPPASPAGVTSRERGWDLESRISRSYTRPSGAGGLI